MKFEKTASGSQKITISKAEWLHIGKQAGWNFGPIPNDTFSRIGFMGEQENLILENPVLYFENLFNYVKKIYGGKSREKMHGKMTDRRILFYTRDYLHRIFGNVWARADSKEIRRIKSEFSKWFNAKSSEYPTTPEWDEEPYFNGQGLVLPNGKWLGNNGPRQLEEIKTKK